LIDIFIYGALLCNVAFFFYVEAYTECTPAYQEKLRAAFILEWYLRVLNQVLLSVLWILLAIGTGWFLLGFFAFYVILLVWDFIILVAENKSRGRVQIKGTIVIKDFQGLLVTAAFVLAMTFERLMRGDDWYWIPEPVRHRIASLNSVEAAHYFVAIAVGICVAAYATILVATCRALEGFNPLRILANRNRLA
jgi:hypothetical protein